MKSLVAALCIASLGLFSGCGTLGKLDPAKQASGLFERAQKQQSDLPGKETPAIIRLTAELFIGLGVVVTTIGIAMFAFGMRGTGLQVILGGIGTALSAAVIGAYAMAILGGLVWGLIGYLVGKHIERKHILSRSEPVY